MAKTFKMFNHVDFDYDSFKNSVRNFDYKLFAYNQPMEFFLIIQFIYILFCFFSHRSFVYSYMTLIAFCFANKYREIIMDMLFSRIFNNFMEMMAREKNRMTMAPMYKQEIDEEYFSGDDTKYNDVDNEDTSNGESSDTKED